MNIGKMGLFYTPQSVKEIEDYIESLPSEDKAVAYTIMGMTWNFLAETVKVAQEFGGDSYEHLSEDKISP